MKMNYMKQAAMMILFMCTGVLFVHAQNTSTAKVNVSVTDMNNTPRKGDLIIFKGESNKKMTEAKTDATGKFTVELPVGDKYMISIKNLNDTTAYGNLNIPALGPNQFYSEPFKVNIQYEPARTFTLDNVHFDFGKSTIRPESYPELQELVDYLKSKEDVKIEIAGHTDNVGKDADNLKLSQQRAEAIRNYVIKKGIRPERIRAKGYGATQPVADNSTDEGRQQNRRTEVRIL
jgi:OmpA-OmpF porin, OOP family